MADNMTNTRCCVCNSAAAKPCSTCKSASYYSVGCQRDDWRSHKLLCKAFAGFDEPRPTPTAVPALYFPILTYGAKGLSAPRLIWVDPKHHMHQVYKQDDGTLKHTDCLGYDLIEARFTPARHLSSGPIKARNFGINSNYLQGFQLNYPVILHLRNAYNFDCSRPNLTLIETTGEQLRHMWQGPLILYSKSASYSDSCQDVTLADFRTFLDFCKVYTRAGLNEALRTNNLIELELTNPALFVSLLLHNSINQAFNGVEIACEGDKQFLQLDQFIAVDVPCVHPIFDDINLVCKPTEISKIIELPLMIRRVLPDKRWNNQANQQLVGVKIYQNSPAEYLDLNTDTASQKWGFHDLGKEGSGQIYGRVLVIREDKLATTPHQVEALTAYFRKVFETLVKEKLRRCKGLAGTELHEERAKIMGEHVSRAKFEDFFEVFKERKVLGGDASWGDELSPDEVTAQGADDDESPDLESLELDSE